MDTVTSILLALASGTFGAMLATLFAVLFDRWREQARLRGEVMIAAVEWIDEIYLRIIDLQCAKDTAYTKDKMYLESDEYALNSRELRSLLIRNSITARIAIVYGEGVELALFNQLKSDLLKAARTLWGAHKENWLEIDSQVKVFMEKQVDPIRSQFERQLLKATRLPMKWLGLRPQKSNQIKRSTTGLKEINNQKKSEEV